MPRLSSPPRTERMLIVRIASALGLALLLVVGAWSSSHGESDAHATLCVAADAPAGTAAADHHGPTTADVLTSDAGLGVVAVICCFLLVLLVLRVAADRLVVTTGVAVRALLPSRAGPRLHVPALTLTQLSVSRT
ncbi:hypothetical protein [Microbacterium sp. LWH10-1.2]|uniref:hypothetical protein n=1 Tax=Microbacterium sp. LWH10-1.2 TaxID=3135255 RepID=UPI003138D8BC